MESLSFMEYASLEWRPTARVDGFRQRVPYILIKRMPHVGHADVSTQVPRGPGWTRFVAEVGHPSRESLRANSQSAPTAGPAQASAT